MGEISLRDAAANDAAAIQAIYAPIVRDTTISFEIDPPSVAEMTARIERIAERYPFIVAERDAEVLGYAYAGPLKDRAAYDRSVEVTVYVAQRARGTGVGRRLYRELFERLRRRGVHSAIAIIALPNAGSVALHERMGFRPVGTLREVGRKFDRWHDVGWWQLMLGGDEGAGLSSP